MIEITNFRQGAVLNHNHGVETEKSLKIRICGITDSSIPVKVNGIPAEMDGRNFSCDIELTEKYNTVCAEAVTPYGSFSQKLVLVWDKKSFRRVNCYLDDHSFLFTELAKQRPAKAFDHFYLAALKKIHEKYGFKVTLNCFYRNDHDGKFTLDQMPDIWKSEFTDNSGWLKFSFHSLSEFPDRPYAESSAEEIGRDCDLVQNEIIRFAGEQCYIAPVVIHWANIHPASAGEMIRRGVRCYSTNFRLRVMGGPSLADRQKGGDMKSIEQRSVNGSDRKAPTEGLMLHYGFKDEENYLAKHGCYYDPMLGVFFFSGISNFACGNLIPLNEIHLRWSTHNAKAEKYGWETFSFITHEQYSFPYYSNCIPDHLQRLDEMARCTVDEGGCKPVFYREGLLGNTARGK